jgi:hypothetical protein
MGACGCMRDCCMGAAAWALLHGACSMGAAACGAAWDPREGAAAALRRRAGSLETPAPPAPAPHALDPTPQTPRYVWLSANSTFKSESDLLKYEKVRRWFFGGEGVAGVPRAAPPRPERPPPKRLPHYPPPRTPPPTPPPPRRASSRTTSTTSGGSTRGTGRPATCARSRRVRGVTPRAALGARRRLVGPAAARRRQAAAPARACQTRGRPPPPLQTPPPHKMGVAVYFLDKLALRAGHEKDEDEADTVRAGAGGAAGRGALVLQAPRRPRPRRRRRRRPPTERSPLAAPARGPPGRLLHAQGGERRVPAPQPHQVRLPGQGLHQVGGPGAARGGAPGGGGVWRRGRRRWSKPGLVG